MKWNDKFYRISIYSGILNEKNNDFYGNFFVLIIPDDLHMRPYDNMMWTFHSPYGRSNFKLKMTSDAKLHQRKYVQSGGVNQQLELKIQNIRAIAILSDS